VSFYRPAGKLPIYPAGARRNFAGIVNRNRLLETDYKMEKKYTPLTAGKKFAAKAEGPGQKRRSPGLPPAPAPAEEDAKGERIAKKLARVGLASRREAEMMIAAGRVAVNGRVLAGPAVNVRSADSITVDGRPLPVKERTRLWLYHKPAGLITTSRDPEGRTTIFDNLPEALPRVLTVGRLDINTEGLLLLTNDGGLARILELPATGWVRRYRVRVHGKTSRKELDRLQEGLVVDGVFYSGAEAVLEREQGSNSWLSIAVREGKNHEIKNILGALGLTVTRLIRTSFGPFQLADLEPGAVLEVRGRILRDQLGARLVAEAQLDFSAPIAAVFPNAPVAARVERRRPETAAAFAGGKDRGSDKARPDRPAGPAGMGRREDKGRRFFQAHDEEGWVSSGRRSPAKNLPPREKPQERASRSANVWHGPGSRARAGKILAAADNEPQPESRRGAAERRSAGSRAFGARAAGRPGWADKEGGDNKRDFAGQPRFENKRAFGRRDKAGHFAAGVAENTEKAAAGARRRPPRAATAPGRGEAGSGGRNYSAKTGQSRRSLPRARQEEGKAYPRKAAGFADKDMREGRAYPRKAAGFADKDMREGRAYPRKAAGFADKDMREGKAYPRKAAGFADRGRGEGKARPGKAAGFAGKARRAHSNGAAARTGRPVKRGRYADNRR